MIGSAIDHLSASVLNDGEYIYYADETSTWYVIGEQDLGLLADLLAEDTLDAYSLWCADTDLIEATAEQIAEVSS